MNQELIAQVIGFVAFSFAFGSIIWFFRGIQKDDREINKDWYERHGM